jgi:hypothetical protein
MSHDTNHWQDVEDAALDNALNEARRAYRLDSAPPTLEHDVLARMHDVFARMQSARAQTVRVDATDSAHAPIPRARLSLQQRIKNTWQRFTQTRFMPALAGSLATVTLIAISAPWWLQFVRETREVATPFMLVSEPQSAQLDVSQMLRVNVSREAMLDFGIPVPPQRLQESVKAEMLMGARGELLAVRFIEAKPERRWRWQLN